MIDKRTVYCISQYENRTFLGALIYLYRISNGITIEKLMYDLKINKTQIGYIQRIERSPKMNNENIIPVINYLGISNEEIKSYPDVNLKAMSLIYPIKEGIELNINSKTYYKYKKIASQIDTISEEEAVEIFARLYFKDKNYPVRMAKLYLFLLKHDSNKNKLAKEVDTSKVMIQKIESGEYKRGIKFKLITDKLISLYGDEMKNILSTYE